MKKIISLSTAILFVCTMAFSSTAWAAESASQSAVIRAAAGVNIPSTPAKSESTKISKDKAVEIAKSLLDNPGSYDVGNISLNSGGMNGSKTWNVDMFIKQAPGGNANVSLDANTGEIINFNVWDNYDGQQNFVAKLTRSEAQIKAEDYIKTQLKEDLSTWELQKDDPNRYGYSYGSVKQQIVYNYTYYKKINGIIFSNDSINVGVDGTSGKVRNFYKNIVDTSKLKFPEVKGTIKSETALEKYKADANVMLQYVTTYDQIPYGYSKQKATLAYVPASSINMMDAVTGKTLNYDGNVLNTDSDAYKKLMEKPTAMNPNAKLETKAITDVQAKAKAEDYRKIIEQTFGVKFDDSNNGYSNSYNSYSGLDDLWNYNWYKNIDNGNLNFSIAFNGSTGRIASMYYGNYNYATEKALAASGAEVKEKYNWAKCKEKALAVVKKLLPNEYGFYVDENIKEPEMDATAKKTMREYSFNFTRLVNGYRFRDNTINLSVDRETGVIRNMNFNWSDLDLPVPATVISQTDALNKYFTGIEAKLGYFLQVTYDKQGAPVTGNAPKLVYTFINPASNYYGSSLVDAVTGKLLDYNGNEIKEPAASGDLQLKDSWAKRSAELLGAQGILQGTSIDLDAVMTRFEAVKMLSLAKGMNNYNPPATGVQSFTDVTKDNNYFTYVENAVTQKLISKDSTQIKGAENITEGEFAKLLVTLIGYGDLAKNSDIFKVTGAANVSDDMTGYVAICKALDILPVKDKDAFDGKAAVTYAQAANALYKALSYIK